MPLPGLADIEVRDPLATLLYTMTLRAPALATLLSLSTKAHVPLRTRTMYPERLGVLEGSGLHASSRTEVFLLMAKRGKVVFAHASGDPATNPKEPLLPAAAV